MWGMRNIKMVLFGSSIMEGRIGAESPEKRYYAQFQRMLSNRFPEVCFSIINGSIGGKSTRELMERFAELVLQHNADYCIFMMGANNNDVSCPERLLKEGEFEALMNEFDMRLPASCHRIGVVLSPIIDRYHSTYHDPAWSDYLKSHGGLDAACQSERTSSRTFFRNHNYPYLDLYRLIKEEPERYILHEDGIHLSPAGHSYFAEKLYDLMVPILIKNHHDKLED